MTDKQKLRAIDEIVANAYEWGLDKIEHKGSFFEGVIASIFAILIMEEGAEE
jgi:hypothetical protein